MESPWLPNVLDMIENIPCQYAREKDLVREGLVHLGNKGPAITAINTLAAERGVVSTGLVFLSLSGSGWPY